MKKLLCYNKIVENMGDLFVRKQITMIVRIQEMEENKIIVATLAQEWKELREDIQKNKRLEFSVFEDVFSKTYKLLSQISMDATVEKQYINLIVNAFLFANGDSKDLEFKYLATMVLTERMLNCYVINSTPSTCEKVPVYILEARNEVNVDFNKINESLAMLVSVFEKNYWGQW